MDCEGEVIPPGQVINILQKKGENAKNAKKLLIIFLIGPDFRRFSQNIVLRSPGGYSSEKDC